MLTKVIIEGVMGRKFGRVWNLAVGSPAEALRMINANSPGLFAWMKNNANVYDRYKVICTSMTGQKESLNDDTYGLERQLKVIRFVPVPVGASSVARIVVGIVFIVADFFTDYASGGSLTKVGAALILSGVIQALTPLPIDKNPQDSIKSDYFNGPVNTSQQGQPVPLVYGRVLVGSHAVSANLNIDRLI